jgi:hypothetical protein
VFKDFFDYTLIFYEGDYPHGAGAPKEDPAIVTWVPTALLIGVSAFSRPSLNLLTVCWLFNPNTHQLF